MNSYQVNRISEKAASEFMEKHEAMGNIGLGVWHYGLYEKNQLLSVVSYGTPCFSINRTFVGTIAKKFNCRVIQLCRGGIVLGSPMNIASQLIGNANHELYKEQGNLIILAYADPEFGEVGAVYQAANAIYLGKTNPKNQSNYIIEGGWLSGWDVRKKYGTRDFEKLKQIDCNAKKFPLTPKYKYLFIKATTSVKTKIYSSFKNYKQPYPKKMTEQIRKLAIDE
jgi:hypothetical protein